MAYDVGTMVLSTPYYVGLKYVDTQIVGWVITVYGDACVVQWADDNLPTSLVIKRDMKKLHNAFLRLQNENPNG